MTASHLRAESNRLTLAAIEEHEQAARECEAAGNLQQAEWHRGKVRELMSESGTIRKPDGSTIPVAEQLWQSQK